MAKNIQFFTIDGVDYYTKKQVAQMTGLSVTSINNRIRAGLDLHPLKLENQRCLLQRTAVEEAIRTGKLVKSLAMKL